MAVRPTQTNEEQRLRMQLLRDKASLETKKGSRGVALDISTDPKETAARRAQFAAKYKKLNEEITDLEDKINSTTKNINKAKARKSLGKYDSVEGQIQLTSIKEKYALLAEAYKLDEDPDIKAKIDTLIQDYKDVSTSVIGRPISLAAARSALTGYAPTFGTPATTTPAPATLGDPTGTPAQPPKVTTGGTTGGTKGGGTTGGRTGGTTGGNTGGATGGASTTAFPQYSGVDTTTLAGIEAASARPPVGSPIKGYDAILAKAQTDYNLPDIIFSNVKSLGKILQEYVDGKIDIDLFKQLG
jgi:hypothetical protein